MPKLKFTLRNSSVFKAHPTIKKVHFDLGRNETFVIPRREETLLSAPVSLILKKYPVLLDVPNSIGELDLTQARLASSADKKKIVEKLVNHIKSLTPHSTLKFIPDEITGLDREIIQANVNIFAIAVAGRLPLDVTLVIDADYSYYPAALAVSYIKPGRSIFLEARRAVELCAIAEMINPGVKVYLSKDIPVETQQAILERCQPHVTVAYEQEAEQDTCSMKI